MLSFKQFINEVRVGYDMGVPKFHENDKFKKTHKTIYSGQLASGHDVTVAKHKKTGEKSVFIHHNGKHIGTIETHHKILGMNGASPDAHKDNVIHVARAVMHKKHQGQGIMTNTYKHLIHHDHTVRSDGWLSHSAHKMWKNIASDKNISVKKAFHGDSSDKAKRHNPENDTPMNPKAQHNEWDHYVATKK